MTALALFLACATSFLGTVYALSHVFHWWDLRGWLVVTEPDGKLWLVNPRRELVYRVRVEPGYLRFEDVDGSDAEPRLPPGYLRDVWKAKGGPTLPAPHVARKQEVLARVLRQRSTAEPGALSLAKED